MGPKALAVVLMAAALSGCFRSDGLTSSFCDPRSGIGPVRTNPAARAALATEDKQNIAAINRFGQRNCGWRP